MHEPKPNDPGKCNAELHIADDYGDNIATMKCHLEPGHEGRHTEIWKSGLAKVEWEGDDRTTMKMVEDFIACKDWEGAVTAMETLHFTPDRAHYELEDALFLISDIWNGIRNRSIGERIYAVLKGYFDLPCVKDSRLLYKQVETSIVGIERYLAFNCRD